MAHFAEIGADNKVVRVIVAEQDFIDSGVVGDPTTWVQTSYNTRQGISKVQGSALRGNYAGLGYAYDKVRDIFIPPQPYKSWTFDDKIVDWVAPKPLPDLEHSYAWNEDTQTWVKTSE